MLGVYITSYILILTSGLPVGWLWFFTALMGLTMAGTGLTVMHDACHGTFSKNNKINEFLKILLTVIIVGLYQFLKTFFNPKPYTLNLKPHFRQLFQNFC